MLISTLLNSCTRINFKLSIIMRATKTTGTAIVVATETLRLHNSDDHSKDKHRNDNDGDNYASFDLIIRWTDATFRLDCDVSICGSSRKRSDSRLSLVDVAFEASAFPRNRQEVRSVRISSDVVLASCVVRSVQELTLVHGDGVVVLGPAGEADAAGSGLVGDRHTGVDEAGGARVDGDEECQGVLSSYGEALEVADSADGRVGEDSSGGSSRSGGGGGIAEFEIIVILLSR